MRPMRHFLRAQARVINPATPHERLTAAQLQRILSSMNFAQKITRLPRPYDKARGADAFGLFPELNGEMADLVAGAGGCSPYLSGLMEKERDWLVQAFETHETALADEYARLRRTSAAELPDALRQGKRRVALLSGLADLAGVWSLEEVTGALTDFADLAVTLALQATVGAEIARGKLPGADPDDVAQAGGMFALAMGKMGAHELNYSSDIDLICMFDETRFAPDDFHDARASFVRATRRMSAMLSELTAEGYVFRTDLRLRPDPAVTPVCIAAEAAERYYESLGRTWERAAYIKARTAAGDIAAGDRFLKTLTPFVWRKHLDFAAIQDAHDMRLRIREHKGLGGKFALPGHNMKLGRGGIREIEFFTQTRQLIAGGRDAGLRDRRTVPALALLAEAGWVPQATAETLSAHYRAHREVEHRVQMINDAQTHLLPNTKEGMAQLAAFMGEDLRDLEAKISERLSEVHTLTEGFFAAESEPQSEVVTGLDNDVISRWHTYAALRSERGTAIFERLKPDILLRLSKASDPHSALLAFDGFLSGLPAGVQLFSLFEANPQLVDLLVDIVSTAPELAAFLARNSSVFDAVIGGDFWADWPGMEALSADLAGLLAAEPDYERKLDLTRRWAKEWHFGIGVHFLRGLITAKQAGRHYSDLAEATLRALFPEVQAHFAAKHGPPPGTGAMVLGMGSLGARRLTSTSDLDIIAIYDPLEDEMSEGKRPLGARVYYARLTQALVTALSAPMAQGKLYEADMRLRPSGNQGPVATSWRAFCDYQTSEAWLWEHLALARARPVCGVESLGEDFVAFRAKLLTDKGADRERTRHGVDEMRGKIAAAKAPTSLWDAKIGPGRMQDIELFAQSGVLGAGEGGTSIDHGFQGLVSAGLISTHEAETLSKTYELLWQLNLTTRFLSDKPFNPETAGEGAIQLLLRETGMVDVKTLARTLETRIDEARALIERVIRLQAEA